MAYIPYSKESKKYYLKIASAYFYQSLQDWKSPANTKPLTLIKQKLSKISNKTFSTSN